MRKLAAGRPSINSTATAESNSRKPSPAIKCGECDVFHTLPRSVFDNIHEESIQKWAFREFEHRLPVEDSATSTSADSRRGLRLYLPFSELMVRGQQPSHDV